MVEERDKLPHQPPLLVKIAPDLTAKDKEDIAAVVIRDKVCVIYSVCLLTINLVARTLCNEVHDTGSCVIQACAY